MKAARSRRSYSIRSNDTLQDVPAIENFNESSCRAKAVRLVKAGSGNNAASYLCQCGQAIVANPHPLRTPTRSPANVVTYKKRLASGKTLIIKQELNKPKITPWIIINGIMFIICLILVIVTLEVISNRITKIDEIFATLMLLLSVLIFFRPRYFIPYLVFQHCKDQDEQNLTCEEITNEQYEC